MRYLYFFINNALHFLKIINKSRLSKSSHPSANYLQKLYDSKKN